MNSQELPLQNVLFGQLPQLTLLRVTPQLSVKLWSPQEYPALWQSWRLVWGVQQALLAVQT